jgi:asparagine synthase (glutamine-hydrolysing)
MVNQYLVNQQSVILKSDLAGEFPIYIYWSKELNIFLYTKSIKDLLNDVRIQDH